MPPGIVWARVRINVITFLFVHITFKMSSFESAVFIWDGRLCQVKKNQSTSSVGGTIGLKRQK